VDAKEPVSRDEQEAAPPEIPEYPFPEEADYGPEPTPKPGWKIPRLPALWVLSAVLLAAAGLLLTVAWNGTGTEDRNREVSVMPDPETLHEALYETQDRKAAGGSPEIRLSDPDDKEWGALVRLIHPFSGADAGETCKALLDLQQRLEKKDPDSCSVYPPWIAYLAVENSTRPSSACNAEAPYNTAVRGIREGALCAWGNAYLAAYYAHKKIADRSLSFLQDAIHQAPLDPWVRIAEALYYQRVLQDRETAEEILHGLIEEPPVSALSCYLLACLFIRNGEYQQASRVFEPLVRSFPGQPQFRRIRDALSSAQQAPYHSAGRARGMLDLGRAFAAMNDYGMTEELCREVLQEMPDRLTLEEKKTAYLELGRIQEIQGNKRKASASYHSALRLDPQFSEAKQRIRTLHSNRVGKY